MEIEKRVNSYKNKNTFGFNISEIEDILKEYPEIDMVKFNDSMKGDTCVFDKQDGIITYKCDLIKAIRCGTEKRDILPHEFD